ncbi:hypothetical protein [Haliea sp. E17]|uniref:hypothetical protein n=1 Tax=Haliea sp. E17 TaxID=3401576 RepID=UPI003AAA8AB0
MTPAFAAQQGEGNPPAGLVELRAVGMQFQGPAEIASGWTTFRFVNASPMTHFALIDKPPAGVTAGQFSTELAAPFQVLMDALNAGDDAAATAVMETFPSWLADLARMGGPGLLSAGRTGETTVYLAPGDYIIECYVKKDGIFHTTSPGDGQLGMLLPLHVSEQDNGAAEPGSNVTLAVRNSGFELDAGKLVAGRNTIRVDFVEQQALPSFVGNDVHLIRVASAVDTALADAWMDWRTQDGLQDPAPVEFLGGLQDLPAGSHGYFTVDLAPGRYAFIAEMPAPLAAGFVLPFSVE